MEIEGFYDIAGIITLAKELHDIGRFDIVERHFFDELSYDTSLENIYGVISSVFSGFYSDYDDGYEAEFMIFSDDVISDYFTHAWEFGKKNGISFDKNPYVTDAENEVYRQLSHCYSMDSTLLGYTKTRRTARQSKLIVYMGMCDCDCHTKLARGLIQLYKWFSDKVVQFNESSEPSETAAVMTATDITADVAITGATEVKAA